jgi:Phage stabilisation protein
MQSTEQTKQIPFATTWQSRTVDNSKDTIAENLVWDVVQDLEGTYIEATKRNGTAVQLPRDNTHGAVRGVYFLPGTSQYLVVSSLSVTTWLDVYTTTTGTNVFSFPLAIAASATEPVRFVDFLFQNGSVSTCFVVQNTANVAKLFVWDHTAAPPVAVAAAPANALPYVVFLDGYLFMADATNIYNSALNDPTTWPASGFMSVESYPDRVFAIARHGQYITAFGATSIQFFYDNANPTGTPLAVQTTVLRIGFMGGLANWQDTLYFLGFPESGTPSVYKIDALNATPVGNWTASRRLNSEVPLFPNVGPGYILSMNGHTFYGWTPMPNNNPGPPDPAGLTFIYDIDTQLWTKLTFDSSNIFPIMCASISGFHANSPTTDANTISTIFAFYTQTGFPGNDFSIYAFRPSVYQDNGSNYTVKFRTKNYDFGTRRVKFGSRFFLNCDQTTSSSLCSLSWTVDDYQTFSTPRTVDVANPYPTLYAIGQFKKIAVQFTYTDNFPMRWRSVELDYDQGTQ